MPYKDKQKQLEVMRSVNREFRKRKKAELKDLLKAKDKVIQLASIALAPPQILETHASTSESQFKGNFEETHGSNVDKQKKKAES